MKLQTKLILLFTGAISLICSIALLLAAIQSSGYGRNLSSRLNTQLIESKAAEASSWLVQRIDELRIISRSSDAMAMDMDHLRPFLDRLNDEFSSNYGNRYGTFALGGIDGLGYVTQEQTIDVSERKYFIDLLAGGAEYTLSTPVYSKTDESLIVLICYAIHDDNNEMIGFVNGAISLDRLTRLVNEIDFYESISFIADQEGNLYTLIDDRLNEDEVALILDGMQELGEGMAGSKTLAEQKKEVFYTPIPETNGWYLCTAADHNILFAERNTLMLSIIGIWLGLLGLTVCLSVFIGHSVSRPVSRLAEAMKQVEQGDLTVTLQPRGNDEITELTGHFNDMVLQIGDLLRSVEQEQQERYRTQFKVLQNQINPHFLYNTLDTLQWKAMDYEADELVELIAALSGFFRTTLSEGREFITLQKELSHVRYYLRIQQYRYIDLLSYEIDVPAAMDRYLVNRLILQPLVENAIYHGIKPGLKPGRIRISGVEYDDYLQLAVEDNGVGMSRETLDRVLRQMEGRQAGDSVGLINVHQRIRLIYGAEYGLSISSLAGEGCRIEVKLPKERKEEGNDDSDYNLR